MSDALTQLLDLLRAKGVRSFKGPLSGERVEIDFAPDAGPAPETSKLEGEPEPCKCGHAHFEHAPDGSCLRGCDVETCAGPEDVKP